ncbi:hypothetical protein [Prauserella endophytica]|uniref:hypothetical protein n=1 Tax=Prauserella endophytica TaxID=1592324 RepID=UPI001E288929|nr:hypothetical protein [Prauserella endophytica]
MRWKETIIGAGAALVFATACGEQPAAPQAPAESPPASQELTKVPGRKPAEPPAQDQGGSVPAAQIDSGALPRGYPVDVSRGKGGNTLTIVGQEGGCSQASAEVGEQRGDRVTVTMVETKPADKNTMCTMDMRYPPITVRLDDPLGDRLLVLKYAQRTE